ncbi:hypothetical protein EDD11_008677 [Mortierella claussenii]|nr:hypothetical protein EDD11_008677 [Mortierella claussenii]
MLAASAHMPFSDVCSTVSCWALFFSVIFPPAHVLALELAAASSRGSASISHSASASTSSSSSSSAKVTDHHQHHRFFAHRVHHPGSTYSLTVYLDSSLERFSVPGTCLSFPLPMLLPTAPTNTTLAHLTSREQKLNQQQQQQQQCPFKRYTAKTSSSRDYPQKKSSSRAQLQPQLHPQLPDQKARLQHRQRRGKSQAPITMGATTQQQEQERISISAISSASGRLNMNSAQQQQYFMTTPSSVIVEEQQLQQQQQQQQQHYHDYFHRRQKISARNIKRTQHGVRGGTVVGQGKMTRSALRWLAASRHLHTSNNGRQEHHLGRPSTLLDAFLGKDEDASHLLPQETDGCIKLELWRDHQHRDLHYLSAQDELVSTTAEQEDQSGERKEEDAFWQSHIHDVRRDNMLHFDKETSHGAIPVWNTPQSWSHHSERMSPWLALIPCTVQAMDSLLAATRLGAVVVVLYQDQDQDHCESLLRNKDILLLNNTALPSVSVLMLVHNNQTSRHFTSPFDILKKEHDVKADISLNESPEQPKTTIIEQRTLSTVERQQQDKVYNRNSIFLTTGSLVSLFKSGIARGHNLLVQPGSHVPTGASPRNSQKDGSSPSWRTGSEHRTAAAEYERSRHGEVKSMVSTPFLPLYTSSLLKQQDVIVTANRPLSSKGAGAGAGTRDLAVANTRTIDPVTATVPRPDLLLRKQVAAERISVDHYRHDQSVTQRLVQKICSFSPTKFAYDATILARDDSMAGKLAMVVMSTICGVGVGMFGALLFVVALKVRLFQVRRREGQEGGRRSESGGGFHAHLTAVQRQWQAQQLQRENAYKRVIPKGVLDSFGIQTVVHTTSTTMTSTEMLIRPAVAAGFVKVKLEYAKDVIEMEEGLEDGASREEARRERLRTRSSHLFATRSSAVAPDDGPNSVTVTQETIHSGDQNLDRGDVSAEWDTSFEGEELGQMTDSQGEAEDLDMEHIAHDMDHSTTTSHHRQRVIHNEKHGSCAIDHSHAEGDGGELEEEEQEFQEKKLPFANANAQTMCSICLGDYEVGEQVRTLPCYHQYHVECIDPWLLNVASMCPICKRDLWPLST